MRKICEPPERVRVIVAEISGSTPREAGAAMIVSRDGQQGTIGGGALEFAAARRAREMLDRGEMRSATTSMPLGPRLGQCCGGHVWLWFEPVTDAESLDRPDCRLTVRSTGGAPLRHLSKRQDAAGLPLPVLRAASAMLAGERPEEVTLLRRVDGQDWLIEPVRCEQMPLWIYGAGHVGRALVAALAGLEFDVTWVDTARDRFPDVIPADAAPFLASDPAEAAAHAPGGALHLVMSFSHAIDFAICLRLLQRGDFCELGVIGSDTKRARFLSRLRAAGVAPADLARLTCPIGVGGIASKTPAAIAIAVAAQALQWRESAAARATSAQEAASA